MLLTANYKGKTPEHPLNMWDLKKTLDHNNIRVEYCKRTSVSTFIIQLCPDQDPDWLLKVGAFGNTEVKFTMPDSLNLVKGIIHHPELAYMEDDEVLEMTEDIGVVKVTKPRHGPYAILAWKRSTGAVLPSTVLVAWDRVRVKPCLPRPRRCYCCHTYGHTASECTKNPVCSRCGQEHDDDQCNNTPHCAACGGDHSATDPNCPKWKEEKEVMKIRHEKKISYSEAVKQKKKHEEEQRKKTQKEEENEQKKEDKHKKEEDEQKNDTSQNQDEDETEEDEEEEEAMQEDPQEDKNRRGRPIDKTDVGGWQVASSKKRKTHFSST